MAQYVVNLERLQTIDVMVDVENPFDALDAAKAKIQAEGGIDWSKSHIDQVVGRCLATGDGGFEVLYSKASVSQSDQPEQTADQASTLQ